MRHIFLTLGLLASACAPGAQNDVTSRADTRVQIALPAMKTFSAAHPTPTARSNKDIQRDFLDLSFQLESGRILPTFTRFEGPISVRVIGNAPPTLAPDLRKLVSRLRNEAGLDIRLSNDSSANVTIEAVPRSEIRRHLPKAACFVVPNISRISQYRSARNKRQTSWSAMETRQKVAIFIPIDTSPQEIRDCLHEELAQAIGPLNDLYRLPDSVFNDDNIHTVLTGFDMLILRAYYAPELRSGMTQNEVAQRLPRILSRLNPAGGGIAPSYPQKTPEKWIKAIQTALGPGAGAAQRLNAARAAVRIAQDAGWQDHRTAFSHFALGRLIQPINPGFALQQFQIAEELHRFSPNTQLHRAHVAAQLAAYSINAGLGEEALRILSPHLAIAARHENAALLSTLMMLQAEALDLKGLKSDAHSVRLDSLGWARYGFGADGEVRARLREISAISPLNEHSG